MMAQQITLLKYARNTGIAEASGEWIGFVDLTDNNNLIWIFSTVYTKLIHKDLLNLIKPAFINGLSMAEDVCFSYRFFISELLPAEIDKVLYLDTDIICTGNIKDLFISIMIRMLLIYTKVWRYFFYKYAGGTKRDLINPDLSKTQRLKNCLKFFLGRKTPAKELIYPEEFLKQEELFLETIKKEYKFSNL